MATFAFFECTNPSCRLRFPLDTDKYQGEFCPRCGARLMQVAVWEEEAGLGPDRAFSERKVVGVLDNIRSIFNVGGIFRTADGVGVEHLYLCGITPSPKSHPGMAKTSLGAENSVSWSYHEKSLVVVKNLKEEGFLVLGLERTKASIPIQAFSPAQLEGRSLALVIGHERAGIDPGLLALCDEIIALPMGGSKASLNVGVAFGAAAYWLSFNLNPGV